MIPVLGIGPHVFEILPLSLQRIDEVTRAKWPSVARFGRSAARQFTGLGDDSFRIEGLIFNEEWGGHDEYIALKLTQRQGVPVDLVGWGPGAAYARVYGAVVLLDVGARHESIGLGGVGRKITFTIEMAPFGDEGAGGLF